MILRFSTADISIIIGILILCITQPCTAARTTTQSLDMKRVYEIAPMLPEKPHGLGPAITDRAAWALLAENPDYAALIPHATKLSKQPIHDQPDELYLDFTNTGTRKNWERVARWRRDRLAPLVLAECLEDRGRFLPAINDLITTLCAEPTWVYPAHDKELLNFHQKHVTIDLASTALGWNLAYADYLLGPRLDATVRDTLRGRVRERILDPFRDMIHGRRAADHWLTTKNNWNSVCLAGVVGAALVQCETAAERAEFVAAGEKFSVHLLSGFTPDGYCSEGLGYWNYGFSHYVYLAETIRDATGGKIDLLAREAARMPAGFGDRIEIMHGVSPAFADCSINAKPMSPLMWILNRRFDMGLKDYQELEWAPTLGTLFTAMIFAGPAQDDLRVHSIRKASGGEGIRTWFDTAGILICRPSEDSATSFAVALKGGHNAEHHNHNDLGSYVVMKGTQAVLLDPGGETYTARTFSANRYDSKLLNSWGHPVPVIAGKPQMKGGKARAEVLGTTFTAELDLISYNIKSAYEVPELNRLERTFAYKRSVPQSLTITDVVEFSTPQTYANALISLGKFETGERNNLTATHDNETLNVSIDTGGLKYDIKSEQIDENAPRKPNRLSIDLQQAVTSATVTLVITP